MKEIAIAIASALVGGSGLVGIAVYYIKRYIDKALEADEEKEKKMRKYRIRKTECDERIQHAQGRMFFWINRAIETGSHNGELKAAFEELQAAEKEKKELEREIIAEYESEA